MDRARQGGAQSALRGRGSSTPNSIYSMFLIVIVLFTAPVVRAGQTFGSLPWSRADVVLIMAFPWPCLFKCPPSEVERIVRLCLYHCHGTKISKQWTDASTSWTEQLPILIESWVANIAN